MLIVVSHANVTLKINNYVKKRRKFLPQSIFSLPHATKAKNRISL